MYSSLIKVLELGEHIFLDFEDNREEIKNLANEVFLNFVLKSLDKGKRLELYKMIETNADPEDLYNFLLENIPNFESELIARFQEEFEDLLVKRV